MGLLIYLKKGADGAVQMSIILWVGALQLGGVAAQLPGLPQLPQPALPAARLLVRRQSSERTARAASLGPDSLPGQNLKTARVGRALLHPLLLASTLIINSNEIERRAEAEAG